VTQEATAIGEHHSVIGQQPQLAEAHRRRRKMAPSLSGEPDLEPGETPVHARALRQERDGREQTPTPIEAADDTTR
jgi:hypothetical protein